MTRSIVTFEQFKDILGEKTLSTYNQCVIDGFNDQRELIRFNSTLDCFVELDLTTKAKFTHNRICGRLAEAFKDDMNIRVDTIQQIIMVNVSNHVLIRQKKFKNKGSISSYPTRQHKKFLNQDTIAGFPDRPTFIVGGYMMDKTNTEMLGVYFACYSANGLEWFTKLGEYVHEQQRIDFTEPTIQTLTKKLTGVKEDDKVRKRLTTLKIASINEDLKTKNDGSDNL